MFQPPKQASQNLLGFLWPAFEKLSEVWPVGYKDYNSNSECSKSEVQYFKHALPLLQSECLATSNDLQMCVLFVEYWRRYKTVTVILHLWIIVLHSPVVIGLNAVWTNQEHK